MRDRQREETRNRLYHAALEIFARDGVDRCRIEDIAQKAEVSRAAFYFHFPSKEDVLLELLRESQQPLIDAINALPDGAPIGALFETCIARMTEFWVKGDRRKILVDVLTVSLKRPAIVTDRDAEAVRTVVCLRFEQAAARNELSPTVSASVLADMYLLNLFAAMVSWGTQPVKPFEEILQQVTNLFMNGASPEKAVPLEKA